MPKEYNLVTVEDFARVATLENIDVLIDDFKIFLKTNCSIKALLDPNIYKITSHRFIWIDDGVVGLRQIKINVVNEK